MSRAKSRRRGPLRLVVIRFVITSSGYFAERPIEVAVNPPVPGAPIIRATLDDTGVHYNPSRVACGVYNVAFSDTRSDRIPGTDASGLMIDPPIDPSAACATPVT